MTFVKNWPKAILWSVVLIFVIWGVLVTGWLIVEVIADYG